MSNGRANLQTNIVDVIRRLSADRKKLAGIQRQSVSGITTVTGSPAFIINQGQAKDNTNNTVTPNSTNTIIPSLDNTFDVGDGSRSHRYVFVHTLRFSTGTLIGGGVSITKNSSNDMLLGVATGRSFQFGTSVSVGATISDAGAIFSPTSIISTTLLQGPSFANTPSLTTISSTTLNLESSVINIGNSTADRVDFNCGAGTDILPKTPFTKNLGSVASPWFNIFYTSTLTGNDINITGKLDMSAGGLNDDIIFSGSNMFKVGVTASSASAGAATLPSNPVGFFFIKDTTGTIRKVPYYA